MNKPIRVLHVLNTGTYSGAENVAISIIEKLQSNNQFDFYYVSLYGDIQEILIKKNIKYIPIDKLNVLNLKKVIHKVNPDVIHAHDYTASIISAMSFPRAKIISHLHNNSPWIKKKGIYSFAFLLSSLFYSKILTVSESIEKEYVFSKLIKNKIECIGNPVDINIIEIKSNEYIVKENYEMIFLGRLTPPKNPFLLIEIIKKLVFKKPDIKIAIVGTGEMYGEVKKQLESVNENIKFYGFVENPYPILKKSKVLCLPSKWEGYGLVAIEALALGIPVVCSGVGGLSNIVNGNCGKICRFNIEQYENEILKLINEEKYYQFKQRNALTRAEQLNNIDKYIKKISLFYDIGMRGLSK